MTNELQVVRDRRVIDFLNDALDVGDPETVSCTCPHCGLLVRYPKAVSEGDLERVANLIHLIERYAEDKGIGAKALATILSQVRISIIQRKP